MTDNHSIDIRTERILLRKFRVSDAETMYRNWASDDEVTKHLTWCTHTSVKETFAVIEKWVEGYKFPRFYCWAIELNSEVIGSFGCTQPDMSIMEIKFGYALAREHWGQGYMTEVLDAVIQYLFSLGYNRISANHYLENPASGRVMEKVGMQLEGIIRDGGRDGFGNYRDVKQYAIVARDRDAPTQ